MFNEKKKVVPKLWQEVKEKIDIITSDDIKIYYTGNFQDFTARYIINKLNRAQVPDPNFVDLYQNHSDYSLWVKIDPCLCGHKLTLYLKCHF